MNLPRANADSAPFWAAAAEQRLLFQRCEDCGKAQFPPRPRCLACGGALRWEESCKRGVIHSYTVVQRAPNAEFRAKVPYVLALIELEEGPRLMLNVLDKLDGADGPALQIGASVRVVFQAMDCQGGGKLPQAVLDAG